MHCSDVLLRTISAVSTGVACTELSTNQLQDRCDHRQRVKSMLYTSSYFVFSAAWTLL